MDNLLNKYRNEGTLIRVVRDANPENDIRGYVVAWNEKEVLIRKRNKKVMKVPLFYPIQVDDQPRVVPEIFS